MKRKKLFWQLYPSYVFIAFLSLVAVILITLYSFRDFFYQKTQEDLESRVSLIRSLIKENPAADNLPFLDQEIKDISEKSKARITIILTDGTVVADSHENANNLENHLNRKEIKLALTNGSGMAIRFSKSINEDMMYYAYLVTHPNNRNYILRAAIPLVSLKNALSEIYIKVFIASIWMFLTIALLSWWLARKMSRPLEEMKNQTKSFIRGDLSKRIKLKSSAPKELHQLSTAMNEMAIELDKKIKTILLQKDEQQAIFSSMAEGVLALDNLGKVKHFNDAVVNILKLNGINIENKSYADLITEPRIIEKISHALKTNEHTESELILTDSESRFIDLQSSPLHSPEGENIGTVFVFSDLTELKKLESHRKDFVANVSHELRTPLTSIQGYAEILMSQETESPEERKKFLSVIHRHALRLEQIIEDLLSISRLERDIEHSQIELNLQYLKPTLESAIEVCEVASLKRNIGLKLYCNADIKGSINSPLLEQAIVNLITNAIKYSRDNSDILISVDSLEKELKLSVIDTGMGIPKEKLPRLFERFYRVDKARSREMGGTGLGLSIVKHVSIAHKGRVDVVSEVNKGSVFSIYLPKPQLEAHNLLSL